ncbi:hypothetical protein P170DRAFT_469693 [Aspergillus steynii IBT 23096]|uniref:Uncharacterized protein n=1 Tax=Aspergillus steynii IBT 23096 TaxID=1392250 RepID=A0A2I2GMZ7_9EURO|nr:uncharacterized protein P170DRAFT_469693 [Aspergillus steynii IBT 23096]PLB54230.1 hypothetical protein P170DRAFT_469693 [Aspergillus steynii IBT 23096]
MSAPPLRYMRSFFVLLLMKPLLLDDHWGLAMPLAQRQSSGSSSAGDQSQSILLRQYGTVYVVAASGIGVLRYSLGSVGSEYPLLTSGSRQTLYNSGQSYINKPFFVPD